MDSQDEVAGLKQSWVTLAINDIYAIGAVVLGYSLREAKTAHKLTVLVNQDVGAVTRHLLGQVFDEILPLTQLRYTETTDALPPSLEKAVAKVDYDAQREAVQQTLAALERQRPKAQPCEGAVRVGS